MNTLVVRLGDSSIFDLPVHKAYSLECVRTTSVLVQNQQLDNTFQPFIALSDSTPDLEQRPDISRSDRRLQDRDW